MKIKKSYIIISVYYLVITSFLLVNSFTYNFLKGNNILLFLLSSLIIFKFILGIEKDNHRYVKDIIFEISIFLLLFFMLYYLFGVLINNFYKNDNYLTFYGLKTFIIPSIIKIILIEILRYATIKKSENSKIFIIINILLFCIIDLTNIIYGYRFNSPYAIFLFIASNVLPTITKNIVATYLSINLGYKPFIFYALIINLYPYILPIIPNYNNYLYSLIMLMLPIILYLRISKILIKVKDEELSRDYKKHTLTILGIPVLLVVFIVYLTSGYFKYYILAIASESMSNTLEKGDIVIVEKIKDNYSQIKEGKIIAFNHEGVIIVHRVTNVVKIKEDYYFYTKGDANTNEDGYPIKKEEIVGIVQLKISYLGLPAVWLNDL